MMFKSRLFFKTSFTIQNFSVISVLYKHSHWKDRYWTIASSIYSFLESIYLKNFLINCINSFFNKSSSVFCSSSTIILLFSCKNSHFTWNWISEIAIFFLLSYKSMCWNRDLNNSLSKLKIVSTSFEEYCI
jgi:hypothetical protein